MHAHMTVQILLRQVQICYLHSIFLLQSILFIWCWEVSAARSVLFHLLEVCQVPKKCASFLVECKLESPNGPVVIIFLPSKSYY